MFNLLISFLVFALIVAIVVIGVKWLADETGFPPPIKRIVLLVIGVIALIVFLVRFVQPFMTAT